MEVFKGENLEDRLRAGEKVIQRLLKRPKGSSKVVVPPYPVSRYVDVPVFDAVLRYMFPIDGVLRHGFMFIEEMPKDGVDIFLNVESVTRSEGRQIFSRSNLTSLKGDMSIKARSRLKISVKAKGGIEMKGIWTSFVWVPAFKTATVEKFLVEDLEKQIQ